MSLCSSVGPKPVRVITGIYKGDCDPRANWTRCNREKTITLGKRPSYVKVVQTAVGEGAIVHVFMSEKFEGMNGQDGWQSNTTYNGRQVQSGVGYGPYYSKLSLLTMVLLYVKG